MTIFFAAEDDLSRAVAERLIVDFLGDYSATKDLGKRVGGNVHIQNNLSKYVDLAERQRVVVLTDLDRRECAPGLRAEWLKKNKIKKPLPKNMAFCIAVREVEAWLLSDRQNIANFLKVSTARIDRDVEKNIEDPKAYLINLARKSRDRTVRDDLVPAPGNSAAIGLGYNRRLIDFARESWDPMTAANSNVSLRRAINRIEDLVVGMPGLP